MWDSIKRFFTSIFDYLGEAGQYIVTAVVLIILAVASIFIIQNWVTPEPNSGDKREVAQNLNPSIGEALPPDVNIDVVTSPEGADSTISSAQPSEDKQGIVNGTATQNNTMTEFVAPATGLNPDKPIAYYNDELGFKLTLPPRAIVSEQGTTVNFYSETGQHLATVSVQSSQDSLADIKAQLSLSPDISGLQDTQLASQPALQYTQKQLRGYALKSKNQIYYLTGQPDILSQISI